MRKTGGGQYHRPTTHSKIPICSECAEKRGLSPEKVAEEIERRIPRAKSVGELFKLLILYNMALKEAKKRNARRQLNDKVPPTPLIIPYQLHLRDPKRLKFWDAHASRPPARRE
mgnify:CR=1 FL=1